MSMERVDRSIPGANLCLIALAFLLSCLNGCAPLAHLRFPVAEAADSSPQIDSHVALLPPAGRNMIDLQKLAELWYRHTEGSALSDYPIGPGDVLEIFVPATEELKNRVVRVSDEGTIFLSFIEAVRAGGLSKKELRQEIRHRHDVIEVSAFAPKLVLYGIDRFFSAVFHVPHQGRRFRACALR
jgi:hypothetical protein